MGSGLAGSFLILVLGVIVTVVIGIVLTRSGRALLSEVYEDERTAASVTRLVVVLFALVVLGVVALLSTAELSGDGLAQALLIKLGIMLLVVGAAYGGTLVVLARIRAARRQQQFVDLTRESLQRAHQPQEQRVIEVGPR
jgi:protein-S-isoprenylcysteine O-methyltransferase Ste14